MDWTKMDRDKKDHNIKMKLTLPSWHIPYLEKHRIMELYREIVKELIIQQPNDHVLFIKQILQNAANARNVSRVVILCSPRVNCVEIAKVIVQQTKQKVITEFDIMKLSEGVPRANLKPLRLALILSHLTRTDSAYKLGWILADCLRTPEEAKKMLEAGVIPTHVFHFIPPFNPPLTELLYCDVPATWPDYRRRIMGIREVLKSKLTEVHLGEMLLHEVVAKCVTMINIREGFGGPVRPRVVILGPRGCGRKSQGKLLETMINIVYIDFEYLLCQAWVSNTDLGRRLRECKDKVCYQSDLLCEVVNQRILQHDCLEKGWVLTGFPLTHIDFKYLDLLETPPNRVFFIECDLNVCRERLFHRRINAVTGTVTDVASEPDSAFYKNLKVHPKDKAAMINAELAYYCEQYGSLRNYCGGTAIIVNGDQPKRWVYECIVAAIVRDSPPVPPRDPCVDTRLDVNFEAESNSTTTEGVTMPTSLFASLLSNPDLRDKCTWGQPAKKVCP